MKCCLQPKELLRNYGDSQWEDWDSPLAFRLDDFDKDVERAIQVANEATKGIILLEGIVLFSYAPLVERFHGIIALDLPEEIFRERRFQRDKWIQKNEEYFEAVVLPSHRAHGYIPPHSGGNHVTIDATMSPGDVASRALASIESWRGALRSQ